MTVNRAEAMALVASYVDALDLRALRTGHLVIDPELSPQTAIGALREQLCAKVAGMLEDGPAPRDPLRALSFAVREFGRDRRDAGLGLGRWPSAPSGPRVLAVPREDHHLRDMEPVAAALEARGVRVFWLVFRRDHHARLSRHRVALAGALAAPDLRRVAKIRAALVSLVKDWSAQPVPGADGRWPRIVGEVGEQVGAQTLPLLGSAAALRAAFDGVRPSLVLVGNSLTPDGSMAVAASQARGTPVATMQHGEIGPLHGAWARCGVDLFTVWGDRLKAELVACGFPEDRVAVTGAPWVDALVGGQRQPTTRRTVLVAMSGAGHAVGMPEHLDHVRRLIEACAARPDVEWIFRLHRKDDPAIYARACADTPGARPRVIASREATTGIHDQLRATDVVITVTSASAMDAMLHGVPVVSLGRPHGETPAGFVRDGATTHVPRETPLVNVLDRLFDQGEEAAVTHAARRFAERSFGIIDGRATDRVVDELQKLVPLSGHARPSEKKLSRV